MNYVLSNMGLLALIASLALLLPSNETTYEVTGALVNEDGAPIALHRVLLYNDTDVLIAVDTTDAEGKFTLAYQVTTTSLNPNDNPDVPGEFKLGSSYPNPFNPKTTIPFQAPRDANVTISLYNILGQEIMRTNRDVTRGSHEIQVNLGGMISQGLYILRVYGDGFSLTQNMTYVSIGQISGSAGIELRLGGRVSSRKTDNVSLSSEATFFKIIVEESDDYSGLEIQVPSNQNYDVDLLELAWKEVDNGDWPRDTETEIVDVLNPATGRTWMDRNLGASRAATSQTDSEAYGHLYQWGRPADGHQNRNSPTTTTLSSSDQPGHGSFIRAPNSPFDWRSPQNDNLWQGVNGTNNPCPVGYRLPTDAEWEVERASWGSNNTSGAFASPLKLPMAGYRSLGSGSLFSVGSNGNYWSSTVSGRDARRLNFSSNTASMISFNRAYGYSVRCLKE